MTKLPKLNLRYRRVLLRLGLVIAFLVIQPLLWRQVAAVARTVHQQRSAQEQGLSLQARVAQIEQVNATQQGFVDQLAVVVPPSEALPQVVERLERIAGEQATQLDILDISEIARPIDSPSVLPIKPVRVAIQVNGSAAQLLNVIEQIEHVQEITLIERWSLNPASQQVTPSPQPGQYTYSLIANVIFFLQADDPR